MGGKIKIQLVGGFYINDLLPYFPSEIYVQNIRRSISPFTAVGPTDEKAIAEWESKIKDFGTWEKAPGAELYELQRSALFDLKKNFCQFLSRDPQNFCDNVTFSQPGHEVMEKNEAQYIIIDNTDIDLAIIKYNNVLYSAWPPTPLLKWLNQQKEHVNFIPSRTKDFNWKFYYDKYIEAILEQYDSDHIILIKTQFSEYLKENNDVKRFPGFSMTSFRFIEEIDNYFAAKTRCHVIYDLTGKIPRKNIACVLPNGIELGKWQPTIIEKIINIIEGNPDPTVRRFSDECQYYYSLAKSIDGKLCEHKRNEYNDFLNYIERKRIQNFRQLNTESTGLDCPKDILILNEFISDNKSLGEYLQGCEEAVLDKEVVRKYTENFLCNLNDILNLYVHRNSFDKELLKIFARNICNQKDNPLIKNAEWLYRCNVECLMQYEYIDSSYLPSDMSEKIYIQINDGFWLVINSENEEPFCLVSGLIKSDFDYKKIIDNGYACSIDYADALTYSYDYYIEKARKGDGDKPTYLRFISEQEFVESLYFVNYCDLLKNERFVFVIGDDKCLDLENYIPVVDFSELFNPELIVIKIFCGLGDQLCYLVLGQIIASLSGRPVLYDDTICKAFNGLEANRFSKVKINLLTDKLSMRLKMLGERRTFLNLFYKISQNYTFMTNDYRRYSSCGVACSCFLAGNNLKKFVLNNLNQMYFDSLVRIEDLKKIFQFELFDFIEFPPFVQQNHIELSQKMNSCDAVVIHVRRGDHVSVGWEVDNEYYNEAIEKVMSISEYKNKKFFVFSDDIRWCIDNKDKLGLNKVGDCEVTFVNGNKEEESFRDIQLMSCCKIMIAGGSYFPIIAALYNRNLELFLCSYSYRREIFASFFKNKYDVGEFSKSYNVNRLKQIPKTSPPPPPPQNK